MKKIMIFLLYGVVTSLSFADSFYEYKGGKRYLCELDEEPQNKCEYIAGNVYCPRPGESCGYIAGNVYCGYDCSYIAGNVYCAGYGESCDYIAGNVYCGVNCEYIAGNVHCSSGGLGSPASPASPN